MTSLFGKRVGKYLALAAMAAVIVAPIGASAATASSSIEATVSSVIAVTSSGTVALSVTPTGPGAESTAASDTVTVNSNDADGYNLTLSSADGTATMAGFKDDGVTSNGATLAVTTGSYATPAALSANSWGWRVDSLGTFGAGGTATFAGMPVNSSPQNIRSTTATATNEVTTVKYAVKVDTSKPNGVYKDTVTYTATAK
ncbi:MAG TPA: hypothetical protein VF572_03775 [Candidatus Saccharimonadales bacterium]|jgi:hypothetical protein